MSINSASDPRNRPDADGPGYETRDVGTAGLLKFALTLAVVIVIVLFGMRWIFWHFAKVQTLGPTMTPFENARTIPPLPRLQVAPQKEIHDYWESQQAILNSYGWVDRKNGVVRIPVDRAMRILLAKGLPARPPAGASAGGGSQ